MYKVLVTDINGEWILHTPDLSLEQALAIYENLKSNNVRFVQITQQSGT